MGKLDGKVAIITGGSGGIGQAAAQKFIEEGAQVLLVDINEDALKEAVDTIGDDNASYIVADVSQADATQAYVDAAVDRYGGIDIYIANAGIEGTLKPITECPIDVFDQVMAVNVRGVWLGLKYVIPKMAERGGGSIVITSSIAGVRGYGGLSPYVTSKHAVVGMMRSASKECAPLGIRVNTVNPAPIETRMMESLEDHLNVTREEFAQGLLMQRYGKPEEVANLMLFLASDDSSYCSGSVYMIDGADTA